MRHWQTLSVVIGMSLVLTTLAVAQPPPPGQAPPSRPTYSPYLNLLRPGSLTNNYYGLVRPQIDANLALNGLQRQVDAYSQTANGAGSANDPSSLATGHSTQFLNYSRYFSTGPRGGGGVASGSRASAGTAGYFSLGTNSNPANAGMNAPRPAANFGGTGIRR